MKILVLSSDFPPMPGGISMFVHNLCLQLSWRGHSVDVLTRLGGENGSIETMRYYRVHHYSSFQRFSSIKPIIETIRLYQKNRYDVLFLGHFTTTHAMGFVVLNRLAGIPYVILSHGNDLSYSVSTRVDKVVAHWLLGNADLMLGNSRFTVKLIREAGYHGPLEVLHPGVDTTKFHPGVDTDVVRNKYGLDGHQVILTVARLVSKKNVDGVLRTLPRVIEHVPNLLYLIAGDGEERERLESLCDELRLRPYVRFLGHIENSQLPVLYCASDLFIMPSYEVIGTGDIETFGISFVEANACSKPVIAGRSGGMMDAVIDAKTGLLVDPYNVSEIAGAIIRLLTDQGLARRLGENGRRRVENEFDWQVVGAKIERILEKVICKI